MLECWGADDGIQLGVAGEAVAALQIGTNVRVLSASADQTCLIDPSSPSGSPSCWGSLFDTDMDAFVPTPYGGSADPVYNGVTSLAFNSATGVILGHPAATNPEDTWVGDDSLGQYGLGSAEVGPTTVPITLSSIALGTGPVACGILQSGGSNAIQCWGLNADGEIFGAALGSDVPMPEGQIVPSATRDACTSLGLGSAHACATCGSDIYCWGDDTFGQLGGSASDSEPTPVPRLPGAAWASVAVGGLFNCAIASNRHVACWGDGLHGQLGNGAAGASYPGQVYVQLR